jgi:hypothetical protein
MSSRGLELRCRNSANLNVGPNCLGHHCPPLAPAATSESPQLTPCLEVSSHEGLRKFDAKQAFMVNQKSHSLSFEPRGH